MIPALLAAPMVQGIVGDVIGGVLGSVAGLVSGPTAPAATSTDTFSQSLNRAAVTTATSPSSNAASGIMHATDWNQMSDTDAQSWARSLTGSHVDATDSTGRTISGIVSGVQMVGHELSMNIGGHLVSLSQLKQISWSPSTV